MVPVLVRSLREHAGAMSATCKVHLLGHCVAGDEHRSAELLMFDNTMFSVGLQSLDCLALVFSACATVFWPTYHYGREPTNLR